MRERDAAEYLGVSVGFLRRRRLLGEAPAYVKMGDCVRYSIEDLERYARARRIDPEGAR